MSTDTMVFLGKWAWIHNNLILSLDHSTGILSVLPCSEPIQRDQRWNVYGDLNSYFWIQASQGKYITFNGQSYVATEERTGLPSYFSLETVDQAHFRLVDHGSQPAATATYYLAVQGQSVTRIPCAANPPATTQWQKTVLTPGLAEIQHFQQVIEGDLTYAYLASTDLKTVNFAGANLSHANLSNADLRSALFPGKATILTEADLSFANMQNVFMPEATVLSADLSYANLQGAELSNANLQGTTLAGANLAKANLLRSNLTQATLPGAKLNQANVADTRFDEANLCNVDFTGALVLNMRLQGALLVGAILSNLDLQTVGFDENTNVSSAIMQNVNLTKCNLKNVTMSHANLTGAILDGANLTGAEMSYVNLTNAKLRNNVKLHSASLSNSMLKGADFTGAQLGAKDESFTLDGCYAADLNSGVITDRVKKAFSDHGYSLTSSAALTVRIRGENWVIVDHDVTYTITKGAHDLSVWTYHSNMDAAVLAGAYMPNANFTSANLYAVNMVGVNWYGDQASAENADLEEVDLACANLSSMNFKQARMYGCNLDYAYLIGSDLSGAILRPSITKKQASLVSANIQGTNFTQAQLGNIVMTNAAVSLNEGPFFTLDSTFMDDLNHQRISQALRDQFTHFGYPLESNATVTINTVGISWTIVNGSHPIYKKYSLINIDNGLIVFGGVIGVHLFNLPSDMVTQLDARCISEEMRKAFAERGYTLVKNATIDQVIIKGKKWHVMNQESDTTKLQTGYVEFYILQCEDALHVYGLAFMVVRTGDDQRLEQFRYYLTDTQITQDVMENSATCPNGQKLQMYTKKPQRLTWEQMMTPNTPPRPPRCVPTPFKFC